MVTCGQTSLPAQKQAYLAKRQLDNYYLAEHHQFPTAVLPLLQNPSLIFAHKVS